MKKILLSIGMIVAVAAAAAGATGAFFSDTETSTGNTFTAGAIDLKIDSVSTYNDAAVASSTWALKDLAVESDKFFNFGDVKPGDTGTTVVSLHVLNNDAYACAEVSALTNYENDQSEPEAEVDPTTGTNEGELQSEMLWTIWMDDNQNGVKDSAESLLAQGHPTNGVLPLFDSVTNQGAVLTASSTAYLGVAWTLPGESDNRTQTDSMTGTISFNVVQSRNNGEFKCVKPVVPEVRTLALYLENEDMTTSPNWTPITTDGIGGILVYKEEGPTFDYTLTAESLLPSTQYSLIYYADAYPGNHPGKLIATATTDENGNLSTSGNPDLNMDLPTAPDANIAAHGGAKIWLIPSANYDANTNSVSSWTPDNSWLFEGNNYINYHDTNIMNIPA